MPNPSPNPSHPVTGEHLAALAMALASFPANGKPPMDDLHFELVCLGFIAEHEVKKPCRNCGTSLTDYRYMKLTNGGRMFLAAWNASTGASHAK